MVPVLDTFPRLLGDVGATHARFAWQERRDGGLADLGVFACQDHASLQDAIRHYLRLHPHRVPRYGAIGIAAPVLGDFVSMMNRDWSFSIAALREEFGFERFEVANDFTALALALPQLKAADLHAIGSGSARPAGTLGVLGPGTGLGVAGLVAAGDGWLPISGEGGHVTLAAGNEREERIVAILRRRFGHASAERALSGPGLVNLHDALREIAGEAGQAVSPEAITSQAIAGTDPRCIETVDVFFGLLGSVAGNLALSIGARGGVYIAGGVVPRLGGWIARSRFRASFEDKGRYRGYLEAIPTWVVDASVSPALLGAGSLLDRP